MKRGLWSRGPYASTLPFTPPPPNRDFYRGNFCGTRIPGAPKVIGGSDADPSLVMACLLDRYPVEIQQEYWRVQRAAGYTHGQRSLGHSVFTGEDAGEFGAGLTADQFLDGLARQRDAGFFTDVWFANSLGWRQRDLQIDYWKQQFDRWFDILIPSGLVDMACVGWQLDQIFQPKGLVDLIDYFAERCGPAGIPVGVHWVNDANAWFDDFRGGVNMTPPEHRSGLKDRFDFWRYCAGKVQWTHFQGDVYSPIDDYQDGLKRVMDDLPNGTQVSIYEPRAQSQFNGEHAEVIGDAMGFYCLCVVDKHGRHVGGYGNGGRRPDGTAL